MHAIIIAGRWNATRYSIKEHAVEHASSSAFEVRRRIPRRMHTRVHHDVGNRDSTPGTPDTRGTDTERRDACVVNYAINYHLITGVSSPADCFVSTAAISGSRHYVARSQSSPPSGEEAKIPGSSSALLLKTHVKVPSDVEKIPLR
jgi:hypothetical protein